MRLLLLRRQCTASAGVSLRAGGWSLRYRPVRNVMIAAARARAMLR
jgi:hypothetical protein